MDPTLAAILLSGGQGFGNGKGYGGGGKGNGKNSTSTMFTDYSGNPKPCNEFRDKGFCSYGDRCRFSHDKTEVRSGAKKLSGNVSKTKTEKSGHGETIDFGDYEEKGGKNISLWSTPKVIKALTMTERLDKDDPESDVLIWEANPCCGSHADISQQIEEHLHKKAKSKADGLTMGAKRSRALAIKVLKLLQNETDPYKLPEDSTDSAELQETKNEVGKLTELVTTLVHSQSKSITQISELAETVRKARPVVSPSASRTPFRPGRGPSMRAGVHARATRLFEDSPDVLRLSEDLDDFEDDELLRFVDDGYGPPP